MGRAKVKRGSTTVDMTAMCDVAFLLLTFFILATEFKPAEAVNVSPPSSVASKAAPQSDAFTVSLDKQGRVFVEMSDVMKEDVIEEINTARNLSLSPDDIKYFKASTFVGVPLAQLNQFTRLTPEQLAKTNLIGIPVDSANNELQAWINAAVNSYKGRKINFLIKGDNEAKYPGFKGVIEAFKKNEIFKYQLVTNPEEVPAGSELYKRNLAGDTEPAE
jgi:biopolymer transport protein ExbD